MSRKDVAKALVDRHGTTFAEAAGIRLKDTPSPLYQLLVLSATSALIRADKVQGIWTDIAPYVDDKVAEGAERVGLPKTPERLAAYVSTEDFPRLATACVRAARSKRVVEDVTS